MAKPPKKLSPAEIEAEVKRLLEPKIDLPAPTVIINKRITNEFTETGGSSIQFKDEGVNQGTPASIENVDFVGAGVTAVALGNTLTVTIPGAAGSGEANTASNVGAGEGVFKQKTGVDLEFKSLDSIDARIVIGSTADEVTFDFDATGLATETYVDDAIDDHEAAVDPHPQYLTQAEADALYSVLAHTHTTTDVAEGTNLYFTTERAQDAVGTILTDTATIDFDYDDVGNLITAATIPAGILAQLLTVDGAGSGLDADLLDGLSSAAFALASHNHSAAEITSGLLALARGGTNADLSATGGTSFVLRQSSVGAAITVSQLAPTELTGWPANAVGTLTNDGAGNLSWVAGGGGYTDEMAQDAVGTILTDSATIDFTYDDGLNTITAATIPAGILAQLLTVDGAGSGLDADLLDGISSAAFGLVANPLSQFAATTSAQLRGVLSDENGTGAAIFDSSTSQTLVTPIIASFVTAQHDHTNAAGGGTIAHSALTGLTTGDPHTQYLLIDGTRAMTGHLDVHSTGIRGPASGTLNFTSRENDDASALSVLFQLDNVATVGAQLFKILNGIGPVYSAYIDTGPTMTHSFRDAGLSGSQALLELVGSFGDQVLRARNVTSAAFTSLRNGASSGKVETSQQFLEFEVLTGVAADEMIAGVVGGFGLLAGGLTTGTWDLGTTSIRWRDGWFTRKIVCPIVYGGSAAADDLNLVSTTNGSRGNIYLGVATASIDDVNNRFGILDLDPEVPFEVFGVTDDTFTDTLGVSRDALGRITRTFTVVGGANSTGFHVENDIQNGVAVAGSLSGITCFNTTRSNNATNQTGTIRGVTSIVAHLGTGTCTALVSSLGDIRLNSTGTATDADSLVGALTNNLGGTITRGSGLRIVQPIGRTTSTPNSTWGNIRGIRIDDQNPSGASNTLTNPTEAILIASQGASGAYAIRAQGTDDFTTLAGKLYVGADTTATAKVHIAAGSTAASSAPIKLTSGTNMTAAEAGAIEFTTDDFFATITTGAARKAFILDDGTRLTSGRVPFATTNGRLVDDSDMTFSGATLTVTGLVVGTTKISSYNGIATVSNGVPSELATVDLTAQGAAIGDTTLYTPTATGLFRVSAYMQVTRAGSVSSQLGGLTLKWNDGDGNVAQTSTCTFHTAAGSVGTAATGNTTGTHLEGVYIIYARTGVAITYATGYASAGATTMQYALHLKVEAL